MRNNECFFIRKYYKNNYYNGGIRYRRYVADMSKQIRCNSIWFKIYRCWVKTLISSLFPYRLPVLWLANIPRRSIKIKAPIASSSIRTSHWCNYSDAPWMTKLIRVKKNLGNIYSCQPSGDVLTIRPVHHLCLGPKRWML